VTPQEEVTKLHQMWAQEAEERARRKEAEELERRLLIRERFRNGELKGHFAECIQCGVAIITLNHRAACPVGRADTPRVIG
jgi:heterodisulfide reductase subunit C